MVDAVTGKLVPPGWIVDVVAVVTVAVMLKSVAATLVTFANIACPAARQTCPIGDLGRH
jgi:predicted metal-binding membrane protein